MRDTWYVLEDGSSISPGEVAPDDKGILRGSNGMAVAIGSHGNPRSRGVEVDEDGKLINAEQKPSAKKPVVKDREVKAEKEGDPGYKTR